MGVFYSCISLFLHIVMPPLAVSCARTWCAGSVGMGRLNAVYDAPRPCPPLILWHAGRGMGCTCHAGRRWRLRHANMAVGLIFQCPYTRRWLTVPVPSATSLRACRLCCCLLVVMACCARHHTPPFILALTYMPGRKDWCASFTRAYALME